MRKKDPPPARRRATPTSVKPTPSAKADEAPKRRGKRPSPSAPPAAAPPPRPSTPRDVKPRRARVKAPAPLVSPAARSLLVPPSMDEAPSTARTFDPITGPPVELRESAPPPPFDDPPITRRSSPIPAPLPGSDVRVPPLPSVTIAEAPHPSRPLVAGFDIDVETAADVAPVGPTEVRLLDGAPDSERRAPRAASGASTDQDLAHQIRDLESKLDELMRQSRARTARDEATGDASQGSVSSAAPTPMDGADGPPTDRPAPTEEETASSMRELFSTDYYLRQWGRAGMRSRAEDVDEFGFDPGYDARFRPLFDFLYAYYFRVEAEGAQHIPENGPCLVVSNHSGGPLPYDGLMLRTAVRREHPRHRELRWLAEDFIYYLPFVGAFMNRLGAVRACQENAERLLGGDRAVAVFPEGAKGIGKLYRERYRLQRFGRGGFIRLALRAGAPIVPCAIVGAEEANPMLYRIESMAKAFGLPYVPVTPTFPLLGPLGLLPAPTKWKIRFGPLVRFDEYGPAAAEDEILVGRLAERVRSAIQSMLDQTLADRRSIWLG